MQSLYAWPHTRPKSLQASIRGVSKQQVGKSGRASSNTILTTQHHKQAMVNAVPQAYTGGFLVLHDVAQTASLFRPGAVREVVCFSEVCRLALRPSLHHVALYVAPHGVNRLGH